LKELILKTGIEDVDEEKQVEGREGDAPGAGGLSAPDHNQGEEKPSLKA
jgi:hypothetical protein